MKPGSWITIQEISEDLKIPYRTLIYLKSKGDFPPTFRFGQRNQRVRISDYELWKEQQKENPRLPEKEAEK